MDRSFDVLVMLPTAVLASALSAAIAWGAGRGALAALGYFLGTGAAMGAAFTITPMVLFTFYCGDDNSGDC